MKDEEVGSVKQLNSYFDFSSFILFFLLLRLNIAEVYPGSSFLELRVLLICNCSQVLLIGGTTSTMLEKLEVVGEGPRNSSDLDVRLLHP